MNYFSVLSIIFGIFMISTRLLIHLFPSSWNRFELDTVYTEKQPKWLWPVGGAGVLLVAVTWYQHFTSDVPYSLVITVIITLTLIKMSQVLFNYRQFRQFAVRLLTRDRNSLAVLNAAVSLAGLALVLLGVFVY